MKLFLRSLGGQTPSSIEVDSGITLAELKHAICERDSLGPRIHLSLVLGDRELQASMDDLDLAGHGVEDGATLTVIIQRVVRVLTASDDTTAKIWSTSTGECLQTFRHSDGVMSARFSPAGD